VPKGLDPVSRGRKLPVPDARPSDQIAKLFPQTVPAKDAVKDQKTASSVPGSTVGESTTTATTAVPLPVERPKDAPAPEVRHSHDNKRTRHP
jgi:membrane-bound lytic murein transglycosylase A